MSEFLGNYGFFILIAVGLAERVASDLSGARGDEERG